LTHHEIDDAVALATTSATRLAIILAAVHAARTKDIGELRRVGIDANNRRLTLAGRVCPLDGRQPALVWRHHLRQDQGWLGVPGHRHRPAFPRLVGWAIIDHDMALTHRALRVPFPWRSRNPVYFT
jgi:hypothetical protein